MRALNFYSSVYHANLLTREKCCTIRLGDKRDKYREGDLVWVTYGNRFQPRRKVFLAVIDRVAVKPISALTTEDLRGESPDMKSPEDALGFLKSIYGRDISPDETVSVIHFSEVTD
ncbi:MAG: RNA-binding protein [Bacillota bacterium]|nr:RNA-binding protein [Bacillota bacterium]